jgi:2-desacetyl-2-hydroxyethyl bacteriochlorophyllide A dehydrogenase
LRLLGVDLNGGFAEYAKVPINRLHRIPAELPELTATLCEPLAVAVHCVRRSNLKIADTVAILGCGPIGLLIAQVAKHAGAAHIIMSDISPFRLAKAKELGFTALDASSVNVVEEIKRLTDGKGADNVYEVAGTGETAKQMIEAAKIQAQVMVVSLFKAPPVIDLSLMHFKEISINTTRCYTHFDFQAALHLMASGAIDTTPLISHVVPLERIAEGFELMRNPEAALKIVIQP